MSISSELLTLQNTKTAIRTAINNKGGSVGASDTFASYATAIDNLPSGGDNSTLIDLIERDITSINIPNGTTKIGKNGLADCRNLTSVTIPSSVTSYGEAAFLFCVALTSVNIPSGATSLSNSMFSNCTALTTVSIPNTVTTIGNYAFQSCRSLTSVTIPSSVTIINDSAFNDCRGLNSITCLPTTPPTLRYNVFDQTNNCPIYVPAESVAAYKAASGWSTYADRIQAIPSE